MERQRKTTPLKCSLTARCRVSQSPGPGRRTSTVRSVLSSSIRVTIKLCLPPSKVPSVSLSSLVPRLATNVQPREDMSSIDTTIEPLPDSLTVAPPSARVEQLAWSALVVGSCLLAALVATWPLATTLLTAVPLGTERESTVPLLNIWNLWLNADRDAQGFAHYWVA